MCRRAPARSGALVAALALLLLAPAALAQSLEREITNLMARSKLGTARVGVCVIDAQSGRTLAGIRESEPFIPASNMKLLTSGAAVRALGGDFEFRTRFELSGSTLIVRGGGDPGFADPFLLDEMGLGLDAFVGRVVDAVRQAGAAGITGLVIDDRVFDREYVHPSWPADQLSEWYCAQVSGLNFHANVLLLYAAPAARAGDQPLLRTQPPTGPWLTIANRARTVTTETSGLWAERTPAGNAFTVRGNVRAAFEKPVRVCLHEGSLLFGRLLAEKLRAAGLAGAAGAPACRLAEPDELIAEGRVIAIVRTPLERVLRRCNADSHNLYAESLLKSLGHALTGQPGSFVGGAAAIRMQLRDRLGPEAAAATIIADGSGMSRQNRVTPAVLARWLVDMAAEPAGGALFVESLAAAGEGTLEQRFRKSRLACQVRAKSGYISGVRCLSGYVTDPSTGRRAAFAILVNEVPPSVAGATVKEFHENVVEIVDRWVSRRAEAPTPAQPEPIGG
ncbi:MAG TPA: D-alanyl-D-alanine carboxypeptidase/D-alanyl-D-alanine-endopeptidase [Phycisphaerales bacterium]|nr:D-alanyl-D-alanine carboxypeptidase/D-alanyl-D-alanine-endopeptidase [Phycisphaerales bacterium]